ncbi:hypothetical protein AWC29_00060 [Mycobacterium triplex]|uniref:TIR domain-containing protein n=1 Tax=Mycobacterium triplex TaxID=47839 RepID=A0A024K1J9_9MYCO|nr:toll/interleukin-1 receptor domain-containing protein [Mycobacterium triplex]ORX05918.1 hypothetical protein AWC29_00060 [Mycobacterium triplex]CDO89950.1 hypothetical protein BN973_04341 [Mycobacterium triplex]
MTSPDQDKHAFVSYVHEDSDHVDRLCQVLTAADIPHWRDRSALGPGDMWKTKIREAIQSDALCFLACFSNEYHAKDKSYQNEELILAAEEFRLRPPGRTWLIPVRFDDCEIPEIELGAGRTLRDLNYVDLFGDSYALRAIQLIEAIKKVMGDPPLNPATVRAAVQEADPETRPTLLRRVTKEMIPDPRRQIELDSLVAQEVLSVIAAMRDTDRFPTELAPGSPDERQLQAAAIADDYWRLVEPFCWSLNVAARWASPADLMPWVKGLRAFAAAALEARSGLVALGSMRELPCLITLFVAVLSTYGQQRWDNFKTLLVDAWVPDPRHQKRPAPLIVATGLWGVFQDAEWVPHILARAAMDGEDLATAWDAFKQNKVGRFHTPTAEWLHTILRPVFAEQFPDDASYDNEFDAAEAFIGIVAEDVILRDIASRADDPVTAGMTRYRNLWFGRSMWRSRRYGNAVENINAERAMHGAAWPPLTAGLFAGSAEGAAEACKTYAESFSRLGSGMW